MKRYFRVSSRWFSILARYNIDVFPERVIWHLMQIFECGESVMNLKRFDERSFKGFVAGPNVRQIKVGKHV